MVANVTMENICLGGRTTYIGRSGWSTHSSSLVKHKETVCPCCQAMTKIEKQERSRERGKTVVGECREKARQG